MPGGLFVWVSFIRDWAVLQTKLIHKVAIDRQFKRLPVFLIMHKCDVLEVDFSKKGGVIRFRSCTDFAVKINFV
jgi:hypothetical protein